MEVRMTQSQSVRVREGESRIELIRVQDGGGEERAEGEGGKRYRPGKRIAPGPTLCASRTLRKGPGPGSWEAGVVLPVDPSEAGRPTKPSERRRKNDADFVVKDGDRALNESVFELDARHSGFAAYRKGKPS